jgi:thioredoxin reductase (NADPH)
MVDRVRRYVSEAYVDGGAYLYQISHRDFDFFLVLDGVVDALESDGHGGQVVLMTYGNNQFSGELNLFSDRASLLGTRRVGRNSIEPLML